MSTIRTKCEIYLQLTIKTPELSYYHRSSVFILIFELFSHLIILLQWLISNRQLFAGKYHIINTTSLPFNFAITKISVVIRLAEIKYERVLLNRTPTSTQLYPPPPSSFQPPTSCMQRPQQYLNQNIAGNWIISLKLGQKVQCCPF